MLPLLPEMRGDEHFSPVRPERCVYKRTVQIDEKDGSFAVFYKKTERLHQVSMPKLQAVSPLDREENLRGCFTEVVKLPNVTREDQSSGLSELHKMVSAALLENTHTSRLGIVVENDHGIVVLRGTVTTYYAKQMAQEAIRPALKTQTPYPVLRNLISVIAITDKDT